MRPLAPGPARGTIIEIEEFETRTVRLSPAAYERLLARHSKELDVSPAGRAGTYRVSAKDFVGRIALPGVVLHIRPKIGPANLFFMLLADAGITRFFQPPAGHAAQADALTFVLAALVSSVERLLDGGLYRGYGSRRDELIPIRGRIDMGRQIARFGGMSHRHVCDYAELTPDTPENRVIAATLRLATPVMDPLNDGRLAAHTKALLPYFAGVQRVTRAQALDLLRFAPIHRLNAAYAPALALCKLVLNNLSLDESAGGHLVTSFLVNMARLFESYVAAQLRRCLQPYGLRVVAQKHDYLDEGGHFGIRPDVLVCRRTGSHPVLVLDTKYKRLNDQSSGISGDLYQVSAYLDRYKLTEGVLVYPKLDSSIRVPLRLRGTAKRLHLLTVDLCGSAGDLQQAVGTLAKQIAALVPESGGRAGSE